MLSSKIVQPLLRSKRFLYTSPQVENKYHEYVQFAISGTNCLLIVSILGFIEQYKEKMKLIDDCNSKLNSIIFHCVNHQNISNPTKLLNNLNDNPLHDNNKQKQIVNTINTIKNNKFPTIPIFIHDDNDT